MYYGQPKIYRVITTLVTAASSYDLTTLATVKAELNLTTTDANRDAVLSRYITAGSKAIANYCNQVFVAETVSDAFFPQKDAPVTVVIGGNDPLQLSRWPVISVASVTEYTDPLTATVLVAGTDYLADKASGELTRLDVNGYPQRWPIRQITVQYTAGYSTVPTDVADACIQLVKWRYFSRMRDPSLRSEHVDGVYEATYLMGTGPGGQDDLPAQVSGALERYRVPVIA